MRESWLVFERGLQSREDYVNPVGLKSPGVRNGTHFL